ncbi:MAG: tyrosine-type recombinase/integrase [Hyphomicrobiaceae bacterium]|nr:tyrosine-type recombinase/integrase [Hyphomicrobiaceae bacterium]
MMQVKKRQTHYDGIADPPPFSVLLGQIPILLVGPLQWVRIKFSYKGMPIRAMLNTGWKKARDQVGIPHVRAHDLKHTFGRRLRAAGVSFEDRQDLLGHRSGRITSHYSAAELFRLIEAAETVTDRNGKRPELVVLRGDRTTESRKTPATSTVRSKPKLLSL